MVQRKRKKLDLGEGFQNVKNKMGKRRSVAYLERNGLEIWEGLETERDRAECLWVKAALKQCSKTFSLLHLAKPPSKAKLWDTQDAAAQRGPSLADPVPFVIAEYLRVARWYTAPETVQWVRACAYKYEDLSSNPQHSCQKLGMAMCVWP